MIDLQELVANVRKLAKEYPDAKYRSPDRGGCYYTRGAVVDGPETPGCIVGQAMPSHVMDRLIEVDNEGGGNIPYVLGDVLDIDYDRGTFLWLDVVQSYQDLGKTWSEAVRGADLDLGVPPGTWRLA